MTVVDTKPEGDPVPTMETREKSHATADQNGPGAHYLWYMVQQRLAEKNPDCQMVFLFLVLD